MSTVAGILLNVVALAGLVAFIDKVAHALVPPPPTRRPGRGRHRDPAGARVHWRAHPAARVVTGSFTALLERTRVDRQERAFASYAQNLQAPGHVRRVP